MSSVCYGTTASLRFHFTHIISFNHTRNYTKEPDNQKFVLDVAPSQCRELRIHKARPREYLILPNCHLSESLNAMEDQVLSMK
jgi:hypothetical protein